MEVRVQLKVCEGCGCLWYRSQNIHTVYCHSCEVKLREYPVLATRKRRGRRRKARPVSGVIPEIWAVAESYGGGR